MLKKLPAISILFSFPPIALFWLQLMNVFWKALIKKSEDIAWQKSWKGRFRPRINHIWYGRFRLLGNIWNDILFLSFLRRSQPSEAWKFSMFNSLAKITAFSCIMEAENGKIWLRMFRKQLKTAWPTNSWFPDFSFCL